MVVEIEMKVMNFEEIRYPAYIEGYRFDSILRLQDLSKVHILENIMRYIYVKHIFTRTCTEINGIAKSVYKKKALIISKFMYRNPMVRPDNFIWYKIYKNYEGAVADRMLRRKIYMQPTSVREEMNIIVYMFTFLFRKKDDMHKKAMDYDFLQHAKHARDKRYLRMMIMGMTNEQHKLYRNIRFR